MNVVSETAPGPHPTDAVESLERTIEEQSFEQLSKESNALRERINRFREALSRFFVDKQSLIDLMVVVDLISTTPVIGSAVEVFAVIGLNLRLLSAVRIARLARLGRAARLASIARVARVTRALRAARGLQFLRALPDEVQHTPSFNRALRIGVPALLVGFVSLASYLEHLEVGDLRRELEGRVAAAPDLQAIQRLPGYLGDELTRAPLTPHLIIRRQLEGRRVALPFAAEPALVRSDRIQGLLVIFVIFTVLMVVYMSSSLARDHRRATQSSLLQQCFSPSIVETFFSAPEILDRYHQPWMTTFFIDVRGFTAASQRQARDLEGLALRLRRVMDIARREIVVTSHGVVDKFMGDAVMGWIGGQFSSHWALIEPLRRELRVNELERATNDVNTLARELADLGASPPEAGDPAQGRRRADELRPALEEARATLSAEEQRQRELFAASPGARARYEEHLDRYRRQVARRSSACYEPGASQVVTSEHDALGDEVDEEDAVDEAAQPEHRTAWCERHEPEELGEVEEHRHQGEQDERPVQRLQSPVDGGARHGSAIQRLLQPVAEGADDLHPREALVVRLHQRPGREPRGGPCGDVVDGGLVLRPPVPVAPVLVGELPALVGGPGALLEPPQLLVVADV